MKLKNKLYEEFIIMGTAAIVLALPVVSIYRETTQPSPYTHHTTLAPEEKIASPVATTSPKKKF